MRIVKFTAPLLLPVVLMSCGGTVAETAPPVVTRAAALLEGTSRGCSFLLSSRTRPGGYPPLTEILLTREATSSCEEGSGVVVLGTSYNGSSLSLLATEQGIAVGFTSKGSPSGSAAISVQLRHLDPQTLSVVRAASLAALNPFYAGYVYSGELTLLADGTTLEVRGSKHGTIPGETGGGAQYLATYPDFFTSTTPPTILAY
ncbi:hypothetical protein [Melittangium boletus]|uniref:Lipoprotein n=1 Tax=Melittangium boletus DSM 14713 TaxID=1294270 RepID=A0A250I816_9BACT|nr:hypothetical protein [Melittangium boletus]ATB27338.1 hypothetical protein MEBOL_000776 [Melittangium boletus DSM 14713]